MAATPGSRVHRARRIPALDAAMLGAGAQRTMAARPREEIIAHGMGDVRPKAGRTAERQNGRTRTDSHTRSQEPEAHRP